MLISSGATSSIVSDSPLQCSNGENPFRGNMSARCKAAPLIVRSSSRTTPRHWRVLKPRTVLPIGDPERHCLFTRSSRLILARRNSQTSRIKRQVVPIVQHEQAGRDFRAPESKSATSFTVPLCRVITDSSIRQEMNVVVLTSHRVVACCPSVTAVKATWNR